MKYTKHSFEYNYKPYTHILCGIVYVYLLYILYSKKKFYFIIFLDFEQSEDCITLYHIVMCSFFLVEKCSNHQLKGSF